MDVRGRVSDRKAEVELSVKGLLTARDFATSEGSFSFTLSILGSQWVWSMSVT